MDEAQNQLRIISKGFEIGVQKTIRLAAERARGHMQNRYLSGNPLKVQTGKLRSNWQVRSFLRGDTFTASVSTNTVYAAAQNYGVKGVQNVKAHTRRARAGGGRRPAKSQAAKLARRSEGRAAAGNLARKDAASRASHGARSKAALNVQKRSERKARGIQQGASGARPDVSGGRIAVRAHDRFMKIPATRYVQRTLRDMAPRVREMFREFNRRMLEGKR